MSFKELDTVVLDRDLPEHGLRRGDLEAVVQIYEPEAVEVEPVTVSGRTQALVTLRAGDVRAVRARGPDLGSEALPRRFLSTVWGKRKTGAGDRGLERRGPGDAAGDGHHRGQVPCREKATRRRQWDPVGELLSESEAHSVT